MHVSGIYVDLNWFLQLIVTAFVIALGLLYLVKNAASKYFVVDDANFHDSSSSSSSHHKNHSSDHHHRKMPGFVGNGDACIVCANLTTKQCSGCKLVRYCSEACQASHWKSGHKTKCKDFQSGKMNALQSGCKGSTTVVLAPASATSKSLKQLKKILFPYEDFVELFNWNKPGFPPCGLLNCGNSCFANVVLQCLAYTRPLVAYLLERGHRKECRRNDWCFLCELQTHIERANKSLNPFSPINVLSRLPNIGGNLGYGKQEDAHEFMRFAIDTMQSVCLDEFGGEKALHPSSQETTLIQHIFGGHLQSQVVCTKCDNVSNQYENMMDLTVEIQGDAASLEECLDQFTVRERLHGDNMYKCDGCNEYVLAWKCLTIRQAPNILTIALKRFQTGRFGKLNKRVTFPETLDLKPYMSEPGDGNDIYKLYAVVVHVDMLNASFFGHYICYTKDFCGSWYRIDDCKVTGVELHEVLSQGAYMLLYSRVCARPSCLKAIEPLRKEEEHIVNLPQEVNPGHTQLAELSTPESINPTGGISGSLPSDSSQEAEVTSCEKEKCVSSITSSEYVREELEMVKDSGYDTSPTRDIEVHASGYSYSAAVTTTCSVEHAHEVVSRAISSVTKKHIPETHFRNNGGSSFLDSGVEYGDRVDENIGTKKLPNENGISYNGAICLDASVAGSGLLDGVMNEMNSLDYRSEPVKVFESPKTTMLLPFSTTEDDAETGKLAIITKNSSGVTMKPLFPHGFLGKRPHRKISKTDTEGLSENGKLSSVCNHMEGSNGYAKAYFAPRQSGCGGEEKDVRGESLSNFNISSSAISFEEQAGGKSVKEVEDDCFLSESIISPCNGNGNAPNLSDENFCNSTKTDDRGLVRKTFSYDSGFHGLSETIAYGESEREDQIPNDR